METKKIHHAKLLAHGGRVGIEFSKAEEIDLALLENLHLLGVVPTVLDLPDVGTAQHELAGTALADTTANGLGKSSIEEHLVPDKVLAFRDLAQIELLHKNLGVDADAHGRQLEGLLEKRIPDEEVTVETVSAIGAFRDPIVVVGSTSVMTELAIFLESTDADEEDCLVLLAQNILTLLGGGMRIVTDHVVRCGEVKFLGEQGFIPVLLADGLLGIVHGLVDALDGLLQVLNVAILGINVLLPIELIDVQRMGKVDVVVTTKATEIRNKTLAGLDAVVVKSPPLPFGKREGNLEMGSGEITRLECSRAFHTVEVVVEARGPRDKHGSADTNEVDVGLEVVLQRGLAEAESLLELELVGKDRTVSAVLEDVLGGKSAKGIGAVEGGGHLC